MSGSIETGSPRTQFPFKFLRLTLPLLYSNSFDHSSFQILILHICICICWKIWLKKWKKSNWTSFRRQAISIWYMVKSPYIPLTYMLFILYTVIIIIIFIMPQTDGIDPSQIYSVFQTALKRISVWYQTYGGHELASEIKLNSSPSGS